MAIRDPCDSRSYPGTERAPRPKTRWLTASPHFTFTLGYGGLGIDDDFSTDEADYHGRADLANAHASLNWHPFGGGFHLSGGAILARDRVDATGTPKSGTAYEFNGVVYTAADVGTLSGHADVADGLVTRVAIIREGKLLVDEPAGTGLRARYRSLIGGA